MLDILYRNEHLVAINKPSGLLVHRSNLDRHETRFAVQLLRDQIGQHVYPLHRLDKGTSGVLLFALDGETASQVGLQFESGLVEKTYIALVRGWPPESGLIDHPLARRFDDYGRKLDSAQVTAPLPAVTRYRRLACAELPDAVERYPSSRYALLELSPTTGRQHQLRRHLKHIAHPIIGDSTWGKGVHNRFFQQRFGSSRLLLACTRMTFSYPIPSQKLEIAAPLEENFVQLIKQLGWSIPDKMKT